MPKKKVAEWGEKGRKATVLPTKESVMIVVMATPCARKDASPKGPAYADQATKVLVGLGAKR